VTSGRPEQRHHPSARWLAAAVFITTVLSIWWLGRGTTGTGMVEVGDLDPLQPVVQAPIPGTALADLMPGIAGNLAVVVAEEAGETVAYRLLLWPAGDVEPEVIDLPAGFGTLWPDPTGRFVAFGVADPEILAGYASYRFGLHVGTPGNTRLIAADAESVAWGADGALGWTTRSDDGVVSIWRIPDPEASRPPRAVAAAEQGTRLRSLTPDRFWLRSPDDSLSLLDAAGRLRGEWSGYHDARAAGTGDATLVGEPDGAAVAWWDGATVEEVLLPAPPGRLLRVELATGPAPPDTAALWIATTTSTSVLVVTRDGGEVVAVDLVGQISSMHWSPDGRSLLLSAQIGEDHAALHLDLEIESVEAEHREVQAGEHRRLAHTKSDAKPGEQLSHDRLQRYRSATDQSFLVAATCAGASGLTSVLGTA